MSTKTSRLETIKLIISSREIGCQEDLRTALLDEGFDITQATLSRDLRQMKVAKATSITGKSVYVLPNNTMYKRVREHVPVSEMKMQNGFVNLRFSGNMAVVKTRPGYASSLAYDIDNAGIMEIIGTVAGDDTIIIILEETASREVIRMKLSNIIPV